MKTIASALCFCLAVSFATALPNPSINSLKLLNEWEKLGDRTVDFTVDKDVIYVTAVQGRFTALKLKSKSGAINIHKVVGHFGDGTEQTLDTKDNLAAGAETKVFDLKGNTRVINRVAFWYDTKNFEGKKAEVELWGRQ